ncbi:aspartate dehydrogenase [Acuticoccus yangtzensis]|uniref:aspartate dehydrogenase n=1 Tax=Acuticoccus yangtzensis TaxID=1443441 RepID=UPI0009498751|nr:aspartate dehydrogenase [Acuticoccus yangtzensis]
MTRRDPSQPIKVAVAGLGAVGMTVVRAIASGDLPGFTLAAVSARDTEAAAKRLDALAVSVPVVPIDALEPYADLVVEAAPSELVPAIVTPFLKAGKSALVISVGALLAHEDLIAVAREHGGQIVVPTGALLGLDAVTAAAEGTIHSVTMVTRKPPRGLKGAPYLTDNAISVDDLTEAKLVFSGTAREAAKGFPANVNVAAALGLAGIGADRTTIEIWADPAVTRNTHTISVDSDSASFTLAIQNIPSENPKTGRITPLSMLAALRKMTAPIRVGT